MQIATWNVNSIRSRQDHVRDWLRAHPVDVLCLQETKVIDPDFPREPFEALGYHLAISGQKSYNGVAIFSRAPLSDIRVGFGAVLDDSGDLDEQKRVLSGAIAGVRVVNLYVPNGASVGSEKYEYKLRWLATLKQYCQEILTSSSDAICVCGDFNIAPENRDIYDSTGKEKHIMSSPAEREALREFADLGFVDIFRKFTAGTGFFSWWDYRTRAFRTNRGWRIDHHWLTPSLAARATACAIDTAPRQLPKPSDHAPVILTLDTDTDPT